MKWDKNSNNEKANAKEIQNSKADTNPFLLLSPSTPFFHPLLLPSSVLPCPPPSFPSPLLLPPPLAYSPFLVPPLSDSLPSSPFPF